MFNDDRHRHTKKGGPVKTLLDQEVEKNKNMNMNSFCTLAISKKLGRSGKG